MPHAALIEGVARALALALAVGVLESAALAALVLVMTIVHPRPSATTRHVLWWTTLAASALLPLVSFASSLERIERRSVAVTASASGMPAGHVARTRAANERSGALANAAAAGRAGISAVAIPAAHVAPARGAADDSRPAAPHDETLTAVERVLTAAFSRIVAWPWTGTALAGVWLAVALGGLGMLTNSLARLRAIKRAASPLDESVVRKLRRWRHSARLGRSVTLAVSNDVDVPVAVGFRVPTILLPIAVVESEEISDIDQIALHEYAHLDRYDDWSNLVQRALERILWFNPVVGWIGRRIALEREIACDDWVVAQTGRAHRYATCLWKLVETARLPTRPICAPGALRSPKQITMRIEQLLDARRNALPRLSPFGALGLALLCTAAVVVAAQRAPAIAVIEPAPLAVAPAAAVPMAQPQTASHAPAQRPDPNLARHAPAAVPHALPDRTLGPERRVAQAGVPAAGGAAAPAPPAAPAVPAASTAPAAAPALPAVPALPALPSPGNLQRVRPLTDADVNAIRERALAAVARAQATLARRHATVPTAEQLAELQARAAAAIAREQARLEKRRADLDRSRLDEGRRAAARSAIDDARRELETLKRDLPGELATASAAASASTAAAAASAADEGASLGASLGVSVGTSIAESFARAFGNDGRGPVDRTHVRSCDGCDMRGADLHGLDLHAMTLRGADLRDADLHGARLSAARLSGVNLAGANLRGADLSGTLLEGTDLHGADLRDAKLDGTKLVDVDLNGARFGGSNLRSIIDRCDGCALHAIDAHGQDLHGIRLNGADLRGANLRGARLDGVRFEGVNLRGADLRDASLRDAKLIDCDLHGAALSGATLSGASLDGTDLGSGFRGDAGNLGSFFHDWRRDVPAPLVSPQSAPAPSPDGGSSRAEPAPLNDDGDDALPMPSPSVDGTASAAPVRNAQHVFCVETNPLLRAIA